MHRFLVSMGRGVVRRPSERSVEASRAPQTRWYRNYSVYFLDFMRYVSCRFGGVGKRQTYGIADTFFDVL